MKKLLTILAFAGLAMSACGGVYEEVKFENQSSYTVSFVVLFDLISKTLEPGQTTSVGIDDGFHGFKSLTIPL
ncbi:MAG: hypothetical protein LBG05_02745, partial [Treponema sp.]|nr:hypothetical protein [Treponema sp.]